MNRETIEAFTRFMIPVVLEAGAYAESKQGTVQNVGKEDDGDAAGGDFARQARQAKTIIDEQVQERLLVAAHAVLKDTPVRLDAEEDTPSKNLFTSQEADVTLVIDPIDGTLQYLKGTEIFSICIALVGKGKVLMALVYFPVLKTLYLLDAEHAAYRCTCADGSILKKELLQAPKIIQSDTVFANYRVPHLDRLSEKFTVSTENNGEITWTHCFFKCMTGEFGAALFARSQVRDLLLGAMIEAAPGGFAVDFSGNTLAWPDGGRIPEVIFGFGEVSDVLKMCLK